jgi:predicted phosphodiesterase
MRLAFVSDIHGNLAALDAVIADMSHRKIQCMVNLGDSLSTVTMNRWRFWQKGATVLIGRTLWLGGCRGFE